MPPVISTYPSKPTDPAGTVRETRPSASVVDSLIGERHIVSSFAHALTVAFAKGRSVCRSITVSAKVMVPRLCGFGQTKGVSRHVYPRSAWHADVHVFCTQLSQGA